MKVTKAMQDVLDAMANGWELGRNSYTGLTWLQEGGIGRGGESKKVKVRTFIGLLKRGLITRGKRSFPTDKWTLKSED